MLYVEEASADATTTSAKSTSVSTRRQAIKILPELGRYIVTGGSATILDVLVFSILTKLGLWYVTSLCISYFLGLTTNFWLSRRFVFGVYWRNQLIQYGVFAAVALNSLLANLGLLQLLVNDLHWDATSGRLVSAACVSLLSFTGHKLYSFAQNSQLSSSMKATK